MNISKKAKRILMVLQKELLNARDELDKAESHLEELSDERKRMLLEQRDENFWVLIRLKNIIDILEIGGLTADELESLDSELTNIEGVD